MTGSDVRKSLGISTATYYRWLREGKLKGSRAGRDWRFPRAAVQDLLRSGNLSPDLQAACDAYARRLRSSGLEKKEIDVMQKKNTPPDALALMVLEHAHRLRASNVHVEPGPAGLTVRERIDGQLAPAATALPAGAAPELMGALKRMAGLDPAVQDRPLSGRFFAPVGGRRIDVLATTFPTGLGESMTLTLLDPQTRIPALEDLGFGEDTVAAIRRLIRRNSGLFVVNGPSGQGKTTTLYSMLLAVRSPEVKIMTVEDPVELRLEGIQQAAVAPGMGFGDALLAMLRSDVNVAMVSELRDPETAHLALSAANSHRVFTVLHAPDAVAAVRRLAEIGGAHSGMLADVLLGVLDQRLVRRVCSMCLHRVEITEDEARALWMGARDAKRKAAAGKGCAACRGTGFRGMIAVGHLLTMTQGLRRAIETRGNYPELWNAAAGGGIAADLRRAVLEELVAPAEAVRVLKGAAMPV
ncbi:MAG: Flp pilus assembly complex ATPase component TadA [Planctomycetes bacterium]|nr:Flp pilus assembly complex ATPase component TadA [Planctomycetota bacterium]